MFTIYEIEQENQQSVFPRLFYFLAKNIVATCGRGGEGAVREAVRDLGAKHGRELRGAHRNAGLKQNVKCYQCASDEATDTRKRQCVSILDEEVCVKEVYTCPWADIWQRYRCSEIGRWYCEEFEKAKFEAYTGGKGQMHLSQLLTEERNNHCRLAMYYRKANLTEKEAAEVFTENRHTPAREDDRTERFYRPAGELCRELYYAMYDAAARKFGDEGRCAVAAGLREFAADAITVLRDQARRTLHHCDAAFAKANFPLALENSGSTPEQAEADRMLERLLLFPMRTALK